MADIQEDPQAPNRQQTDWGIILQSFQDIADQTALITNAPAFNQAETLLDQLQVRVAALERQLGENTQRLCDLEGKQTTLRQDLRSEISHQ